MQTVISKDGSRIAYDRVGSGPTVIPVAGVSHNVMMDVLHRGWPTSSPVRAARSA